MRGLLPQAGTRLLIPITRLLDAPYGCSRAAHQNLIARKVPMHLAEYSQYDGLGLAELVRKKEVTCKELGELLLDGVEKVNPQINAVIETYPERVMENIPQSSGAFFRGALPAEGHWCVRGR